MSTYDNIWENFRKSVTGCGVDQHHHQ